MKRTALLIFTIIINFTIVQSQTYNGKLGYGVSPAGHPYDYSQLGPFLQEVANTCNGGVVFGNAGWRDSIQVSGNIPGLQKAVSTLQPVPYNYTDMINFGWRSGTTLLLRVPGDTTNNWTNTTMRSLFLNMLIHAADSLQPAYLFIGNETSRYWEMDSVDYLNWVGFYHEAYDSIKVHAPNTKVGTVFNYEHLSGQGELANLTTPYWQAFDAHDTSKIDVLGLTVYPFFHDTLANDIPNNYLDPIFSRIGNKPLVITETGWPADSFIGTWESSPIQQEDYVDKLFTMIDGHNVEVVDWLFLNYMKDTTNTDADKIFRSVALRDSLGNDRPALAKWLTYCNTTGIANNFDNEEEKIKVYPNPTSQLLNIDTDYPVMIQLYNSIGQSVLTKKLLSKSNRIDLGYLSYGIYYLKGFNGNKNVINQKIIFAP